MLIIFFCTTANSSKNSPKIEENPIVENPDTSSDDPNADQGAVEVSSTSSSAATSFFNSGDFTKKNVSLKFSSDFTKKFFVCLFSLEQGWRFY